jgi:hypothetical protein
MKKIPFRFVLPVVQFILFVTLTWFGCPYIDSMISYLTAHEGNRGMISYEISFRPSVYKQIAVGLNFPVVIAGFVISIPIQKILESVVDQENSFHVLNTGMAREIIEHSISALLVPFLWFFAGRAIDRKGGPPRKVLSRWKRIAAYVVLIFLYLLGCLMILGTLYSIKDSDLPLQLILILCWIAAGIIHVQKIIRISGRVQKQMWRCNNSDVTPGAFRKEGKTGPLVRYKQWEGNRKIMAVNGCWLLYGPTAFYRVAWTKSDLDQQAKEQELW